MRELFAEQKSEISALTEILDHKRHSHSLPTDHKHGPNPSPEPYFQLMDFLPSSQPISLTNVFHAIIPGVALPKGWQMQAHKILSAWRDFRLACEHKLILVIDQPMVKREGFYLFTFQSPEILGRVEIGFTRSTQIDHSNFRQAVQYMTSSGLVFQGKQCTRTRHAKEFFDEVRGGDLLTMAVSTGIGQITIINHSTSVIIRGPVSPDLPVDGQLFAVIRADADFLDEVELEDSAIVPTLEQVHLDESQAGEWVSSGPLISRSQALLDFRTDITDRYIAFTTDIGAANWVKRLVVDPLWQLTFPSDSFGTVLEVMGERQSKRRIDFKVDVTEQVLVKHTGKEIVLETTSRHLSFRFRVPKNSKLFILATGLSLNRVDYP